MIRAYCVQICILASSLILDSAAHAQSLDFNRDVRPILANKCFHCHGPDAGQREADLRLDLQEGALADLGGYAAIKPGDTEASEAIRRVFSEDDDERMPPADSKLNLSDGEKQTLRRWVAEGAAWEEHWSFVKPVRPRLPTVIRAEWPRNAIDRFVLARLEAQGLSPSRPVRRETLIRRVSLDLTGLPPTPAEVDAFLADESDEAYERVVDRLLRSPRYGERMAWEWLDAARYADTDGFQGDPTRSMWPWRDWLVRALNDNQPFDQFTIEMLAGDLLDNATEQQIIATGFNRNHMYNGEGGRIAEETRVENVFDRTETTSTVWLGLTMTCARCHDHKFDPITQAEYYSLYAFFNNTSETGRGGRGQAAPARRFLSSDQRHQIAELDARIPSLETDAEKEALQKQRKEIEENAPMVMVMDELPAEERRTTRILTRGIYDKPEDAVSEATPAALHLFPADAPKNRLELAKWLMSPENPLTARVTVNRYWQSFFGRGLVETTEDFGQTGSRPTHPQLLDWLAVEFVQSGWNVKRLHKTIVMSATYQQSSGLHDSLAETSRAVETDPENKLLWHAPRFRLPAWMLRDQALALSDLLVEQQGGPSVKPYQPDGIWAEATFGQIRYQPDAGDKLYRRSLYIFWRRIVGPTMFFDVGKRQTCEVKPTRTNTPLHALTTLNETAFFEAARAMAGECLPRAAIPRISDWPSPFDWRPSRWPEDAECAVLARRIEQLSAWYNEHPQDAQEILSVGQFPRNESLDAAEHAAWTDHVFNDSESGRSLDSGIVHGPATPTSPTPNTQAVLRAGRNGCRCLGVGIVDQRAATCPWARRIRRTCWQAASLSSQSQSRDLPAAKRRSVACRPVRLETDAPSETRRADSRRSRRAEDASAR